MYSINLNQKFCFVSNPLKNKNVICKYIALNNENLLKFLVMMAKILPQLDLPNSHTVGLMDLQTTWERP